MSDATALRLLSLGLRILMVTFLLLGPRFWPWLPGRVPERGSTFFGVRVPSDFAASEAGRDILRVFRRRLWIYLVTLAAIFAVAAPSSESVMFSWYMGTLLSSWIISWVLYPLAGRRTRIEVGSVPEPSIRTAMLLPEGQPQPRGMAIAAWIVMVVPLALPLITGILLAWNWSEYPAKWRAETQAGIAIASCFGFLMTGTLYALRYRARASDWAATPEASLEYRTYLGLMMGTGSLAVILWLCVEVLLPLYGIGTGWFFGGLFLVLFGASAFVYRLKSTLIKLFDPQSSDPMPDHCWKWTTFYYNPSDPAWVVPTRSGTTCSLNHARPVVLAAYVLATAGTLVSLVQVARRVPDLIRTESAIQKW
jgi:uncharacterized membrane protein